jgi:hypothetical protein
MVLQAAVRPWAGLPATARLRAVVLRVTVLLGGQPKFSPLAIVSMILGILSIPGCCCWFLGAPMAVAGLVLGIIGMGKIRGNPQMLKGGGMAIAGIVCSSVGLILDLVAIFSTIDDNLKSQYGGGF